MSFTLYYAALVLHVAGITMMAGTSFTDLIVFRAFNAADISKKQVLLELLNKLQRLIGIGMGVILVSGVAMMAKMHEVWGTQLWFRIKMILLLVVIFNGLGLRRVLGNRLDKSADPKLSNKLYLVQVIQLLLFVLLFTLSIFKFN
ncbi:hypothetical protein [Chitinophaga sp. sic0106]|uniref:hypothetical protein n=1 Tax=Chitinophaga sp. sic0106 TaxID=2854785 RepID=UPI001C4524F5|nr:hypothetical protein [Chitinophaga sp. sic0106]MBV7529864.1 hypothetical protein [Chitinophaga sp. sic0106]